jgi:hypothetical protein
MLLKHKISLMRKYLFIHGLLIFLIACDDEEKKTPKTMHITYQ